jgi:hypothetical protein
MLRRDSVDTQKITVFTDSQAALIVSKMTRRAQDKPLREWSIGGSEIYSRKILPLRLSTDGYLDIEVYLETKQPTIGKTGGYGAGC